MKFATGLTFVFLINERLLILNMPICFFIIVLFFLLSFRLSKNSPIREAGSVYSRHQSTADRRLDIRPKSGVKILVVDGFAFKDLNKNGKLDKYEDWRLVSR